ncbi:hypothetical protein RFI_06952 [Reticulomyxa filosa]|uniref:M7GpppX diphosphatase n=1 Tax=Reticulomyxa filosa TaxID=46433 RepID=X6NWA9_RETFI|nr:hypothetical protein RFI_06952 [Reticulomyxa filosa]|eukprot:ETO30168.1 hypothetical protein RFI_06952 [Reticulomyxa filosa]
MSTRILELIDECLLYLEPGKEEEIKSAVEELWLDKLTSLKDLVWEETLHATANAVVIKGYFGVEIEKPTIVILRRNQINEEIVKNLILPNMKLTENTELGTGFAQYKGEFKTTTTSLHETSKVKVQYYPILVDLIYPWTKTPNNEKEREDQQKMFEKHYKKYKATSDTRAVRESMQLYTRLTKPYIDSLPSKDIAWVQDILLGKKELEKNIVRCENEFVSVISQGWSTHVNCKEYPNPLEWKSKMGTNDIINNLHIIAILFDTKLKCIRDLCLAEHISLLVKIKEKTLSKISEIYGIVESQVMAYVHYPPQFYSFHIHFQCIPNVIDGMTFRFMSMGIGKAILLDDIIENLQSDLSYYQTRSITCSVRNFHPLYDYVIATEGSETKK